MRPLHSLWVLVYLSNGTTGALRTNFKREKNIMQWYDLKGISVEGSLVSTREISETGFSGLEVGLSPSYHTASVLSTRQRCGVPPTSWPPPNRPWKMLYLATLHEVSPLHSTPAHIHSVFRLFLNSFIDVINRVEHSFIYHSFIHSIEHFWNTKSSAQCHRHSFLSQYQAPEDLRSAPMLVSGQQSPYPPTQSSMPRHLRPWLTSTLRQVGFPQCALN